ncbi:thiol-disulfide oxidoreductase ResA [Sporosarcina sp. Marseille-Q4063]|uniref:thiol-disulfide oxidoreductase ResA n=1 Tax=Sporosarcina sp. Marseille-Q4063 TaxID=2810514 RepID=UPI001BAF854A|nr:thiol-disulfide oxidoreductase ResA [Sporosarcina sp. Marseille-Q4063]QUW23370.1 thiol-disulfide oxidoreductase ResA [Sporosarcina sp. Marseille-Q4063]
MNNKKKNRLIMRLMVLIVLTVAIVFAIYNSLTQEKQDVLKVGDHAPDFVLVDLNGETHQLSKYKGQGVFLNFWGTWCAPCKKEMPAMGRQYEVYKDQGVQILAVNIAESDLKVQTFAKQYGMSFPTLIDKTKVVMEAYSVRPLPTTFLINPDGKIIKIITGEMSENDIKDYMEQIKPS